MAQKSSFFAFILIGLIGFTMGCQSRTQGTGGLSEINIEQSKSLIGHWRNTEISFEDPIDVHLVLEANGNASIW